MAALSLALLWPASGLAQQQLGFAETFALAKDRDAVLNQLIPGTQEYYYYNSLHALNQGKLDKVEPLLAAWIKTHGNTGLTREIEYRHAVLLYENDPEKSLAFLRRTFNLRFDHQQEVFDKAPDLPSNLEADRISREAFTKSAFTRTQNTDAFNDSALAWLAQQDLDPTRRRHLLSRLTRPDVPGLVELVVADLKHQGSRGFGSFTIHANLTKEQLEQARELYPALQVNSNFVSAYLQKLRPSNDVDWRHSQSAYTDYLDRLWDAVSELPPAFNSLKAHVLFHQLVNDREQGKYDEEKFLSYLRLPRRMPYINTKYLDEGQNSRYLADLSGNFESATKLAPVGNDEEVISSYLQHFFVEADGYQKYSRLLNEPYLKRQFAEAKILNGIGDQEQWYSYLSPTEYQALKERVDLRFAYTNPDFFATNDSVELDLLVKNVDKLIVKVFEINTRNYYQDQLDEINTNINLDGLVANKELNFEYEAGPLRQVRRHFEFPELKRPGVFVIDFIGNGKSSRVVVRKGKLRHTVTSQLMGHVFTIRDENNNLLSDASIWLSGREFSADEDGTITIPYTNQPQRQAIVIRHEDQASLDYFQHESENYQLDAGIYVDRESLVANSNARALIRANLMLNGELVPLDLLENVSLVLSSVDIDEVSSTKTVKDFNLENDKESIYEFKVPNRLRYLTITLKATVKKLSNKQDVNLAASNTFSVNQVDTTLLTEDLHLGVGSNGYYLALLGKTGEPRSNRPVAVQFRHRDFNFPISANLKTDPQGQIALGKLTEITGLEANTSNGVNRSFTLSDDSFTYPSLLHAEAATEIALPYLGDDSELNRMEASLLEIRDNTFVADRFEKLSLSDGMVRISGLEPGDYSLSLPHNGSPIYIRVSEGKTEAGYVLGDSRQLETTPKQPFVISSVEKSAGLVRIQTKNHDSESRIHILATRFVPAFSAFDELGSLPLDGPIAIRSPRAKSMYIAGRQIGDEYQYILDRRYARVYPGNMLERPSLLLNPWDVRSTETSKLDAAAGEDFGASRPSPPASSAESEGKRRESSGLTSNSSLDFLAEPTTLVLNLLPNEEGVIELDLEQLEGYGLVRVLAVSSEGTQVKQLWLDAPVIKHQDLRLADGLEPDLHYTQRKAVDVLRQGETLSIDDIVSSRFEAYRSIADVYRLYTSLTNDSKLAEFSFILEWNEKSIEEKRTLYSKFACHELNYYLSRKDPDFFADVIQPYIANKYQKTFVDHYLLNGDLSGYQETWRYEQRNIVEQILLVDRMSDGQRWGKQHIRNLYEMNPTSREAFNQLFAAAIKGNALESEDAYGLFEAKDKLAELGMQLDDEIAEQPQNAPRAGGGFGGGGGGIAANRSAPRRGGRARFVAPEEKKAEEMRESLRLLEEESDDSFDRRNWDKDGLNRRKQDLAQFYQQVDKTKEWAENNYYKVPLEQTTSDLVQIDQFWLDFAQREVNQPFFSPNFPEAAGTFTEMMFALAILDLPIEAPDLDITYEDRSMSMKTQAPMVAFHEQIQPINWTGDATPVLVSQNFFRQGERYITVGSERVDRFVTDEFLSQSAYGCQVVITNPTSTKQKIDVLLQIPEGALPLNGEKTTNTVSIDLEPYNTKSVEYSFYFPQAGTYQHFPVHVSKDEKLVAFAEPQTFTVVDQLSKIDEESWAFVSQYGSNDEVVTFIESHNMLQYDLSKIAFRMKDKAFFERSIDLLSQLRLYNSTLWSYGFMHNHVESMSDYLQFQDGFVNQVGAFLDSTLLVIDPVVRRSYEHLEYRPLVNARSHQLGSDRTILNDRFYQQYQQLMKILTYRPQLDQESLMAVTYYMLLQNRIDEAIDYFGRVNPDQLSSRIQYDYFDAYLAMYQEEPERAKQISERYTSYAVDRWRQAFENVVAQVNEISGAEVTVTDDTNRDQNQDAVAQSMPTLSFEVNQQKVQVDYKNVSSIEVNYYIMDIELLFSRNPFVQQQTGQFSFIRPNEKQTLELPEGESEYEFEIPESLRSANMLIEIVSKGVKESKAYYSNAINVQVVESFGILNVGLQSTGKPLPKTYVKVFARMKNGRVQFYKDGYTDLRGRFDYTSLSTNDLDNVERFSVLVYHDEHGATVREAAPPKQ